MQLTSSRMSLLSKLHLCMLALIHIPTPITLTCVPAQAADILYNYPPLLPQRVPDQLSKAAGKLAEALAATGLQLTTGVAVDLGAAPGGCMNMCVGGGWEGGRCRQQCASGLLRLSC